jgi:hypothetical protein
MKLRLINLLIILFVLNSSLFAQDYSVTLNKDGSKTFHEGKLVVKEGTPFLTVKGNSYEMGLQYGVLLNNHLIAIDETIDSMVSSYVGSFFLKKWIAGMVFNSKVKKVEKTMPAEYVQELKGMAEGCDLSMKDLQTIAYFPQIFYKISCTAFVIRNELGVVHGRNLDWPSLGALAKHPLIVNYYKKEKNPVTILSFVGYPGVYTGMNHAGLSMSINMNGTPAENDKEIADYNTGMPLAFKLRNILENGDELKEVDEQFKNYSSHAWFITVGSKKDNNGALYELTRGEVIKNEMKDDFISVLNLSLSDKGRYSYSPIWMFGTSNTSRERKIKELYERYDNSDLIEKSYKILTSTENHHLSHDPFYRYSINNSITVKSCIMDNMNNQVYFTYGEHLAALNKYLKYDIETGDVSVYKEKQEVAHKIFFDERLKYQSWYKETFGGKNNFENEDYQLIIVKIKTLELEPAYQAYLLSSYYSKLKNHKEAFENAEKYIEERPNFFHSYYNKFNLMRDKGDYMGAIVAMEEMLQTSTINPYYEYLAHLNMIRMYDKLLTQKFDEINLRKVDKLADEIRTNLRQYFIDKSTQKDLDEIRSIEEKYY